MINNGGSGPGKPRVKVYLNQSEGCGYERLVEVDPAELPDEGLLGAVGQFVTELWIMSLPLFRGISSGSPDDQP